MEVTIRRAEESDREVFVNYTAELSRYNRANHNNQCKYDNYEFIINSIRERAYITFDNRSEDIGIFIAELAGKPIGYALGRIFVEDGTADNGTGRMGLFDELFIAAEARGLGAGQKLLDETITWLRKKEIKRIKLQAYSWNKAAKSLYEKNGFREYAVSYECFI